MKPAIVYKEGKAFLITEMPEEPKCDCITTTQDSYEELARHCPLHEMACPYRRAKAEYDSALQSAISSAIEIAPECQELVKQLVEQSVRGVPMTGVSYIVEGIEFEVKEGTECKRGKTFVCIQKQLCGCPVRQLAIIRLSNSEVGKEETEKESQTKRAILELIETDIGVYKLSLAGARAINDELEKRYRMGQIHALEMLRFEIINANAEASRKNPLT
jgi:hypothetical protein